MEVTRLMEVTKTVVCKLATLEEEFRKLMDTKAFGDACNYISEVAWDNRVYNPVALHHLVYYETRERFKLPANLAIAIRAGDGVAESYTYRKEQHRFRQLSMDLDKRFFTLLRNGKFRASISTTEGGVEPKPATGDYQRELLKNPVRDAKPVYRSDSREFYLHITALVKVPEPKGNNFVGVDIGTNKLLVASNGFSVNGKPEHRRQHFRKLGSSLQQKGTFSAKRRLKQLSGREHRWVNTVLHQVSRVNSLQEGDTVVMEKLNGIGSRCRRKSQRATFHSWAFNRLQQMVEYKCEKAVVYDEPKHTSRRCPRCGTINKRRRFVCGYQHNADYVASFNLASFNPASFNLAELVRRGWGFVNRPDVGVDDCLHEITHKPPSSDCGS
ncbi:MAG: transposase [Canidatus Methanoxibalbensis ujae]|nr:transposase [Candidatus Methanoxibalbensis ujae]